MATESVIAIESLTLQGGGIQPITPAERWALICKNVYTRAQKRGFVGGNPLQDLADAEQEIDAGYETDFDGVFALTSTVEITEQLKSVFAGYGVDQVHLSCMLDGHQEALEKLAAKNRERRDDAPGPTVKQTQLLKNVACEAVQALQSLAQGRLRPEVVLGIVETAMQEIDNALNDLQGLTSSVPAITDDQPHDASAQTTSGQVLLKGVVSSDYQDHSAEQLMAAPISALEGFRLHWPSVSRKSSRSARSQSWRPTSTRYGRKELCCWRMPNLQQKARPMSERVRTCRRSPIPPSPTCRISMKAKRGY